MKRNEWDFPVPGRGNTTAQQWMQERRNLVSGEFSNPMGAGAAAAAAQRAGVFVGSAQANANTFQQRGRGRPPGAMNKRKDSNSTLSGGHVQQYPQYQQYQQYQPPQSDVPVRRKVTRAVPKSVTQMPDWYVPPKGSMFQSTEDVDNHVDTESQHLHNSKPIPLHYDLRAAVELEGDRRLERMRSKRLQWIRDEIQKLDALEAGKVNGGGEDVSDMDVDDDDKDTSNNLSNDLSLAQIRQRRRKLKVEEKSLVLVKVQDAVRAKLVSKQKELMEMPPRTYKKTVKEFEKMKELSQKEQVKQKKREKEEHFKQIKEWRRVIYENAAAERELTITKNRAIIRLHEKLSKDFAKRKRDEQALQAQLAAQRAQQMGVTTQNPGQNNVEYQKRVEALKANDMEAYRQLLAEARGREGGIAGTGAGGEVDDRYASLQEFLEKTEGYLSQLGGKIAALKLDQQRSEAAAKAVSEAEERGATEEEVLEAAEQAANKAAEKGGKDLLSVAQSNDGGDSKQKYYALAHTEMEKIARQPKMLTAGTLRDYQITSLQWMISLYNNKLNGILADEMGLGKTVQVCALIAYLWESKQNYGPHLIIVPNAVIVNWKSEIKLWLSKMEAVYYVGGREERAKIFQTQVTQLKFNVLVTTYEFIMRDRSKLSKVNWQYIIIDEAQRLKDREGRLSRDLDRFRCNRRLLLTGTPLQNDLSELWSLLNLLLPQVFDNAKIFQQWFGNDNKNKNPSGSSASLATQPVDQSNPQGELSESDWMEKEKKIIVVSRLHQILEPFMLRRLVQDVERKLPPKVNIVIHAPFSAYQASVYDWVQKTGTIRVDATVAKIGLAARQNFRGYLPLQNRCMELRKICNHPALNYPAEKGGDWRDGAALVRACGKLWVLDRLLVKLRAAGHRVLLFSTMTKLLDLLEVYMKWRQGTPAGEGLEWCRIDGSTSLDDREVAITEYNAPDSKKFLFLLSIRAAGRGLNLQTADTVVVYDPDPNPKNEEQAVARSHRIGQKREVRCIYLEAVVDAIGAGVDEVGVGGTTKPKQDSTQSTGTPLDDRTWGTGGTRTYAESIESVVRNVIQQQKIEMADEIINAGRFDQQTTHAERRETLEKLMSDQAGGNVKSCAAPSLRELNRQVARTPEEIELFNKMDADQSLWPGPLAVASETPAFITYYSRDRDEAVFSNAKPKPGRAGDLAEAKKAADAQLLTGVMLGRGERSRGGYVPGAYRAADQALTGADAAAALKRAAQGAAKKEQGDDDAGVNPVTDLPATGVPLPPSDPTQDDDPGLDMIEAEDSEVTQNDDDVEAGVVNFDAEEEEEEDDDGVRIGPSVEEDEKEKDDAGLKRKRDEA